VAEQISIDTERQTPAETVPNHDLIVLDERGKVVLARYGDGRPAVLSDGSNVRYTAGGQPVIINRGGTEW